MRKLPKVVAGTSVGKNVEIKVWRNKKLVTKRLTLGRLESSEEFKQSKTPTLKDREYEIETLKITVRDLNSNDIETRNLNKNQKGSVVLEISTRSPLSRLVDIGDIIIEVQKKKLTSSNKLDDAVKSVQKNKEPLYLTIINKRNQREYLGIKIN